MRDRNVQHDLSARTKHCFGVVYEYEDTFSSGETVHEHDCVLFTLLTMIFPFGQVCKIVKEDSKMSFMLIAVSQEKVSSSSTGKTHPVPLSDL